MILTLLLRYVSGVKMSEVDLQERDGYHEWVTTTPAMFANPIRALLKKTPIDKWKGDFLTMRLLTFVRFIRMITKDGPADLDKIQDMGLLAVKLTQIRLRQICSQKRVPTTPISVPKSKFHSQGRFNEVN